MHPFGPLVSDVWTDIHRIKHNKYRDTHPCQLPIHLLERIILMTSDEGDIILDPFSGTGTTAIAAKRLGRQYIGFDIDKNYVVASLHKLEMEKSNSKIGDIWISFFIDSIVTLRDKDWSQIANNYLIPENMISIDQSKIDFIEKKKTLQHFDIVINRNGTKKIKCNFHLRWINVLVKCSKVSGRYNKSLHPKKRVQ